MANSLETKKLKAGAEVQIDNQKVTHLRSFSGAGLNIPQVNATTTASKNVEYTTGRISFTEAEIVFANADTNFPIIDKCCKYMDNPMKSPRMTIAINEITRDNTPGASTTLYECFPTVIELPKGDNDNGTLETRIKFSIHRVDQKAAGIS